MTRRIRLAVAAVFASLVVGTAACSDVTSPSALDACDTNNSTSCLQSGIQHSGT